MPHEFTSNSRRKKFRVNQFWLSSATLIKFFPFFCPLSFHFLSFLLPFFKFILNLFFIFCTTLTLQGWKLWLVSLQSSESIDWASRALSKCSWRNKSIMLFLQQYLSHRWLPPHYSNWLVFNGRWKKWDLCTLILSLSLYFLFFGPFVEFLCFLSHELKHLFSSSLHILHNFILFHYLKSPHILQLGTILVSFSANRQNRKSSLQI